MKVSNLVPNERYVFALAAYTANGKLIGDHIGETTKSFLASHPLPVLTTWAFVCQVNIAIPLDKSYTFCSHL